MGAKMAFECILCILAEKKNKLGEERLLVSVMENSILLPNSQLAFQFDSSLHCSTLSGNPKHIS